VYAEGTGIQGVRQRRDKFEAFLAGSFRYLYIGQYESKEAALAARDAALVVVYGPDAAAKAHGVEQPERISDAELRAMAAKLAKKAGVMDAMTRNGRTHLLQPMQMLAAAAGGAEG
jgi:hypothetical protein